MGLLPDTQNCGCACAGNAGNVFPVTAGKRSRHASRHVRDARAVMHVGIVNWRFLLKSAAGENVPGIPGACATYNLTYLVRGPLKAFPWRHHDVMLFNPQTFSVFGLLFKAARCSTVRSFLFKASSRAPWSIRTFSDRWLPFKTATCRGEFETLSRASMSTLLRK